jgi:beta-1,4-N-acetylglucosaminyltransferase
VILVTVGSNGAPFDRLLREVDGIAPAEELVVQHGPSQIRPRDATCVPFMHFSELERAVAAARIVITHAGVGSVLLALMNGKRPVVVPRLARYGEVVDDHQLHFAERLEREVLVTLVREPTELRSAVAQHDERRAPATAEVASALADDLRNYLENVLNARR